MSYLKFWYYNKSDYIELKTKLKETKLMVRGESISIPKYMASVIEKAYGKKEDIPS